MVPDRDDVNLPTFIQSWIQAASDAAGQCAKLTADLEPLESQSQLIKLLQTSADGISNGRKALTALGASATPDAVNHVLRQVSWHYCLVLVFSSLNIFAASLTVLRFRHLWKHGANTSKWHRT